MAYGGSSGNRSHKQGGGRSYGSRPMKSSTGGYKRRDGSSGGSYRGSESEGGSDRPRYDSDRPRYDRGDKSRYDKPRYNSDRPKSDGERPRYGGDRPSYNGDRPRSYEGRDQGRDTRPHRDGDRGFSGQDRYPRKDREYQRAQGGDRPYRSDRGQDRPYRSDRDGDRGGFHGSYGDSRGFDKKPRYGSGDKPRYGDRSGGKPYGERSEGKPYGDRGGKPAYQSDRPYRSERDGGYSDRKPRSDSGYDRKPRYGSNAEREHEGGRSGYGDRDHSGAKSYGDRSGGKPYGDRSGGRPYDDRRTRSYGDSDRKPFNRDDRGGRPSYRDDRGGKSSYGDDRGGKPSYRDDRGVKPSYRDDRGGKSYRDDRGGKGYSGREGGRPYRDGGREQRSSSDRYPRRDREESSYRPGQWADGSRDRDREGTYPKQDSRPRYDAERRPRLKPWERDRDEEPQAPRPGLEAREDEPPVPVLDEDVKMPKGMRAELKSLDLETAREVGAYLMTAGQLIDTDPELAYRHAEAARRRAARLPITREAAAETAYAAGLYEEALSQYKTLRRMTGSPDLIPVTVDCLRAVGRYRDALELADEGTREITDPSMRVELLIVTAGVRVDMGQREEAMRLLRREIDKPTVRHPRLAQARLLYAYSDLLAQSGDMTNARRGFAMAARLDPEGTTAALDRLDEMDGVILDLDEAEFIDFGEEDYPEEESEWDDVESDTWAEEDEFDEDEDDIDSGVNPQETAASVDATGDPDSEEAGDEPDSAEVDE